jgi:hypothetical protein
MTELDLSDVEWCTTVARSARSILASFECLACGRSYSRGAGECCSARCRAWVVAGEKPYAPTVVKYTMLKGAPMPMTADGFAIKCRGCRRIFSSKGLRCCSAICEANYRHDEDRRATLAELGIEPSVKRLCQAPGCSRPIPKWERGRRVQKNRRFCTRSCEERARRNPAKIPSLGDSATSAQMRATSIEKCLQNGGSQ